MAQTIAEEIEALRYENRDLQEQIKELQLEIKLVSGMVHCMREQHDWERKPYSYTKTNFTAVSGDSGKCRRCGAEKIFSRNTNY